MLKKLQKDYNLHIIYLFFTLLGKINQKILRQFNICAIIIITMNCRWHELKILIFMN